MLEFIGGKAGILTIAALAGGAQALACDCDFGPIDFEDGPGLNVRGPDQLVAGQSATFSIQSQGLGPGKPCPTHATFEFVGEPGAATAPRTQVPNPPIQQANGSCVVTVVGVPHTFPAGKPGTTRNAQVNVEIFDAKLNRSAGSKTVRITTPASAPAAVPPAPGPVPGTQPPPPGGGSGPIAFAASSYSAGQRPMAVTVGDSNGGVAGGGFAAVATDQEAATEEDGVEVQRAGSLGAAIRLSLGAEFDPSDITCGDLTGDGIPDLAVSARRDRVAIFKGSGDGTFAPGQVAEGFGTANGIAVGDLNGDGYADVVTTGGDATEGFVAVAFNRGAEAPGELGTPQFVSTSQDGAEPGFNQPQQVALGDLTGDGKRDVAVADPTAGTVSVLRNVTADGGENPQLTTPEIVDATGGSPFDVSIADVDKDGRADLVVPKFEQDKYVVYFNDSSAESTELVWTPDSWDTGDGPISIAVRDIDGDGRVDVAAANHNAGTSTVRFGDGTREREFGGAVTTTQGSFPVSIGIYDLGGDSLNDLAVANYGSGQGWGNLTIAIAQRAQALARASAKRKSGSTKNKVLKTSGSLDLQKGTKLGKVTVGGDGVLRIKGSTVVGKLKLKVAGKRLKGEPAGLRTLLGMQFRGKVDAQRTFSTPLNNPVLGTGTLVGRSTKSRSTVACVKVGSTQVNGRPVQTLKLIGATGKAATLRLSAQIAPFSLDASPAATGTTQPVVSVSTGKKRSLSKSCRALVKKLPKAGR